MTLRRALSLVPLLLAAALPQAAFDVSPAASAPAPGSGQVSLPERSLYRIHPARARDFRPLLRLGLDVAGTGPEGSLDVILTPAERDAARALGFEPVPLDLWPAGPSGAAQSPLLNPNLGDYHNYAETHAEMAAYAASHPFIALLDTIGFSLEGRPIEAVKISDNVGIEEPEPEALVVGCHHARELMSVELPLYLMRRLLDGYGADPMITSLVTDREIWIVPILNPDGYVYVQNHANGQSSGWWRKNRRVNGDGSIGVDLNRNYGFHWGWDDVGSSPIPTSETYRGTGPFSEPETAALRGFMAGHEFTIAASFHSYGELFLYPWGYDELDTPDHAVFHALGDSVSLQNGYRAGNPKSGAIYLTNGDMDDWVYGDGAAKPSLYGFTFELNTADQGGFAPPDAMIGPTCELNAGPLWTLLRYADAPRRILAAARPSAPTFVQLPGELRIGWTYPAPDPANPPVRHDVRSIASLTVGLDDAEGGVAAWDSLRFEWSTARRASGLHSYGSGAGNSRTSTLTAKAGLDVAPAESLIAMAYWDLEGGYDYWYAEASADGGATWTRLPGNWTTQANPFGKNEGNGITGTSGGVFRRAAFSLGAFAGAQVLARFRCVTDNVNFGEGLYVDDIAPTAVESGVADTDTQSAEAFTVSPTPGATTWFQVRAVDAEAQPGRFGPRARFEPDVTAVGPAAAPPPALDRLLPNVPNPFNPRTEIRYRLGAGREGPYRLDVYDVRGRRVARLREGWGKGEGFAGVVAWDGRAEGGEAAGSGIYFVELITVRGKSSRKITLLR